MTRPTAWLRAPSVPVAALWLSGCDGVQSVLAPQGPEAARVALLTWVLISGSCIILIGIIVLTALAMSGAAGGGGAQP